MERESEEEIHSTKFSTQASAQSQNLPSIYMHLKSEFMSGKLM